MPVVSMDEDKVDNAMCLFKPYTSSLFEGGVHANILLENGFILIPAYTRHENGFLVHILTMIGAIRLDLGLELSPGNSRGDLLVMNFLTPSSGHSVVFALKHIRGGWWGEGANLLKIPIIKILSILLGAVKRNVICCGIVSIRFGNTGFYRRCHFHRLSFTIRL
jgi:hypothetical protein